MKRIITILLLMFTTTAFAAGQQYYNYPAATSLPDNGRILMYDGSSSKNITGAKIKSEVLGGAGALVKQAPSGASDYARIFEIKNQSGVITSWINAKGQMTFGTPKALAVNSVFPVNGATGVSLDTVPTVVVNKYAGFSVASLYIQGDSTAPVIQYDSITWTIPITLAANTTYVIKVNRTFPEQTDGETTSSCGSVMTDVAGVCTSTFTTGQ